MAKKKKDTKSRISNDTKFSSFLKSERTDFLLGLFIAIIALVAIISMISFLSTGAYDQSLLEKMRPNEWLNNDNLFKNRCRSVGAIVSNFLITKNFGLPSFLIPFFLIVAGGKMMRLYRTNLWKWFFSLAFSMIWLSVTFAKVLPPEIFPESIYAPGGQHGEMGMRFTENLIGTPGLIALLFFTAVAFITYLRAETIIWMRKVFNPVDTISGKIRRNATASETEPNTVLQSEPSSKEEKPSATKAGNAEPDDMPQSTVIDLTRFDDADSAAKKPNKEKAPMPKAPKTPDADAAESGKLTVDTGVEAEKASGKSVAGDADLYAPINPREPFTKYECPTLDLLSKDDKDGKPYIDMEEIKGHNEEIIKVLKSFGIEIREIKATVGPTITLYEITPAEGIRITKIRNLEDDIALRLSALGVRIIAPIPGKGTIGIEVPNKKRHNVPMESILNSKRFQDTKFDLPIVLGKTITNEVFMADLTKIPHLLVAGATGQGKSVGLNVIITSLLYKKHPNELKLVLIDPKKVEFSVYSPIAEHFMAQVDADDEAIITDVTKVVRTLKSLCTLMDHRYDMLKLAGARNIKEYNDKFIHHKLNLTKGHEYMPYIVVIIDEFGDLIMTAGKEVEMPIARIAQLARAVGIHMIIATQRPTTSIITGNIKANFPGRIAFKVSSMMDSRIILDRPGANQLIGLGDMLYTNGNEPTRVQCAFISTQEIESINHYIANQPGPVEPLQLPEPKSDDGSDGNYQSGGNGDLGSLDQLFEEAARLVVTSQQGSTSMLQRRFEIGYNRAGRLMDQLEKAGVVGAAHGSKPREVLITDDTQLAAIFTALKQ